MREHLIPLREYATHIGIGYSTAARWCALGQIPAEKHEGRWFVTRAVLEQHIAEQRAAMQTALELLAKMDPTAPAEIRAAIELHRDTDGAQLQNGEDIDSHLQREYPGFCTSPA